MDKQLIDVKADIRERLLHVAIRLFAEKGIDAVSMRTINTEAGSKNKSAVHYHFGSKLGIVEAIFEMLNDKLSQPFEDLLEKMELRAEKQNVPIPEILLTYYLPFFIIHSSESYGPYAIKLFSKMMLDPTPEYQELFNNYFKDYLERIYQLMKKEVPDKPDHHLKFQLVHSTMETIMGIATIDLLENTPLGKIEFNSELEMVMSYVDYVSGGLSNSQSGLDQIDVEFWQTYFQENALFNSEEN